MKYFFNRLFLLFALGVLTACQQPDNELHLYNWNNYIAPETIARFEKVCQCKLVQSYYSDNEEMLAKLAAGATGYDVLVPTGNAVHTLIKQNALQVLDKAQLPNFKNIDPAYRNTVFDPDNQYSVPYAYTINLLGYNDQKMQELGIVPDSWSAIFDPEILQKIKGRVTVLDSAHDLIAAALMYLGYSVTDTDEAHWQEAKNIILKAKPYWAAFNSSSYIKELALGNIWLVHGYSSDIFQADRDAQEANRSFRIQMALPQEGAVFSLDNTVIHKDAPRPDLAHQFINFMLDGENAAELTNLVGTGSPNAQALPFINQAIANNVGIFPSPADRHKLIPLQDLLVEQRRVLNRIWTEIRSR